MEKSADDLVARAKEAFAGDRKLLEQRILDHQARYQLVASGKFREITGIRTNPEDWKMTGFSGTAKLRLGKLSFAFSYDADSIPRLWYVSNGHDGAVKRRQVATLAQLGSYLQADEDDQKNG